MELYKKTAHELHEMLKSKEVSSVEITKAVMNRIDSTDDKIGAYITRTDDIALDTAKKVDERIANGESITPLEGIPMGLKDNICTDGVLTTCASKMLYNFVPPYDAFVAQKLKEAKSPMLGKLNMDEYAMGSSTETSYFKKTRNPYNLDKVPGGSSGGSAAAVSADSAIFALGSDTGGSVRQPASFCGVVGFKPTYGVISRYGVVPFASSFDQIGTLTKDVTDCAFVLNAITGHDEHDSTSLPVEAPDYTKFLVNDVKGLRIGILNSGVGKGVDDDIKDSILNSAKVFEKLGAEVDYVEIEALKHALPAYYILACAEASANLARFDGIKYGYRTENYSDLDELYKKSRSEGFGEEVRRRIMLGTYALSSGYYDAYYKKAQQVRTIVRKQYNEAFKKFDVIISPTAPTTAFDINAKMSSPTQMYLGDIFTVSINVAALPAMSIPCGLDKNGMPIGLQLIAKSLDEKTLLKTAYTFEQNTDYHMARPTI